MKKRTRTLLLFYNGKVIDGTDKKKTFNELANKASKETNVMNVVATDKVEQQLIPDSINDEEEEKIKNDKKGENGVNKDGLEEKSFIKRKKIFDEEERMKIRVFFIQFYLYLLIQFIFIGFFSFLGFYIGFDDAFSATLWAFCPTIILISLFAIFLSLLAIGLPTDKREKTKIFLLIVYVPIMVIFIFLLKRHRGVDIIEAKYFIYQIIIFAFDCLICILYNLVFQEYRGWLNALFLIAVDILAMVIFCVPISNNYEKLRVSHDGLVGLSVINSIMIIFLLMFNFEILDKESFQPLHFAIVFNYLPFVFIFVLLFMIGFVIFIILILILYLLIMLVIGLFSRN